VSGDVQIVARTETRREVSVYLDVEHGTLTATVAATASSTSRPGASESRLVAIGGYAYSRDEREAFKRLADRAWDEYENRFGGASEPEAQR
jgi:hypothetical protein